MSELLIFVGGKRIKGGRVGIRENERDLRLCLVWTGLRGEMFVCMGNSLLINWNSLPPIVPQKLETFSLFILTHTHSLLSLSRQRGGRELGKALSPEFRTAIPPSLSSDFQRPNESLRCKGALYRRYSLEKVQGSRFSWDAGNKLILPRTSAPKTLGL